MQKFQNYSWTTEEGRRGTGDVCFLGTWCCVSKEAEGVGGAFPEEPGGGWEEEEEQRLARKRLRADGGGWVRSRGHPCLGEGVKGTIEHVSENSL